MVQPVDAEDQASKIDQIGDLISDLMPESAFVVILVSEIESSVGRKVWTASNMEDEGVIAAAKMVIQRIEQE